MANDGHMQPLSGGFWSVLTVLGGYGQKVLKIAQGYPSATLLETWIASLELLNFHYFTYTALLFEIIQPLKQLMLLKIIYIN